jgi:hypothetical protein
MADPGGAGVKAAPDPERIKALMSAYAREVRRALMERHKFIGDYGLEPDAIAPPDDIMRAE